MYDRKNLVVFLRMKSYSYNAVSIECRKFKIKVKNILGYV